MTTPPFGPQNPVAVQSANLLPGHRNGHQPRPVDTATPLPSAQQPEPDSQRPTFLTGLTYCVGSILLDAVGGVLGACSAGLHMVTSQRADASIHNHMHGGTSTVTETHLLLQ